MEASIDPSEKEKLAEALQALNVSNQTINKLITEQYGSYKEYLNNLTNLMRHLKTAGALTIFAIEERDFYQPDIPREQLRPFDAAMIAVTETNHGRFLERGMIKTLEGPEKQKSDLIYETLRKAGVEEIRIAGEWSYNGRGSEACLGEVAEQFGQRGFRVRGIESCIFPAMYGGDDNKTIETLYTDSIPLGEVLQPQ